MNINNIKAGDIIKNYKVLCELLDDVPKNSTNSKKAQLKEWECYFLYEKQGQKFVIKEIYEDVHEKVDGRGKSDGSRGNNMGKYKYYDDFKNTLLAYLDTKNGKDTQTSKNWFRSLNLVNSNYTYDNLEKEDLLYKVDVNSKIRRIFFAELEKLKRDKLITYEEDLIYLIRNQATNKLEEYTANAVEKKQYEELQQATYKQLSEEKGKEIKSYVDTFLYKCTDKYYSILNAMIQNELNWNRVYKVTTIRKTTDIITTTAKVELNKKIYEELYKQITQKYNEIIKSFEDEVAEKWWYEESKKRDITLSVYENEINLYQYDNKCEFLNYYIKL